MKRNIVINIIILFLASINIISCGVKDIKFDQEVVNFGEKDEGIKFETIFVFKNIGTATISIKDARPTCTCLTLHDWDKTVKPGENGKIPITFDSTAIKGEVTRSAEVYTDVPEKKMILLTLHGIIRDPLVEISPRTFFLSEIKSKTKELGGTFRIKNNLDTPLKILKVIPPDDIKTTYKLSVVEENQKYTFDFVVYPPYSGKDLVQKNFTLKTNNEKLSEFNLVFSYRVLPAVEVFPNVLHVDPEATEGSTFVTNIFIRNNSDLPIQVSDFSIENGEGFLAQTAEILKDVSYKIDITFPKDYQFNPDRKTVISFRVKNDPEQILYSIPIVPKPSDSSNGGK